MRLLIVEDDVDLGTGIAIGLTRKGYAVDVAQDGQEAMVMLEQTEYDLMVLDLNLPYLSGWEVLKNIRQNDAKLRILILSAQSFVNDKVKGLELGANDYLTKPFSFLELEARIQNQLRQNVILEKKELIYGPLKIDTSTRNAQVNNQDIHLTRKEFGILEYLMKNAEEVLSAEKLIEHVWDSEVDLFSNTFKYHIYSLRKKIRDQDEQAAELIQTVHGVGYKLSDRFLGGEK